MSDLDARHRMQNDLATSLFIEAGAGTGKTTAIVSRVLALISSGAATIEEVVCITFTEAAAAELRVRIRRALQLAHTAGADTRDAVRLRHALHGLDAAPISTIHGFAADLIRRFGAAIGCPPVLEVLTPASAAAELTRAFRQWFATTDGGEDAAAVADVLALGMLPIQLEGLALALAEEGHSCRLLAAGDAASEAVDLLAGARRLGADACELPPPGPEVDDDDLPALRALRRCAELCRDAPDAAAAAAALCAWERIPRDRRRSAASAVGRWAPLRSECDDLLDAARSAACRRLLVALGRWATTAEERRRRQGRATFADLLLWARDLSRLPEVRRAAALRWRHLIVDEFQDTDPLQAEIIVLLAADPAYAGPWNEAAVLPGRLCVVGDPKQSIYRFRRADVAVYEAVRGAVERSAGAVLHLERSYRSAPAIIDAVNRHFAQTMRPAPGIQPDYHPLEADRRAEGPALWTIGGEVDGNAAAVWQAEADDVAAAIATLVREPVDVADGPGSRPVRYGDICLLMPTRTNLGRVQRSLDGRGIPFRVEGGELLVRTQEVREVVALLTAIERPADAVAVVAALRSAAYAISDTELLEWRRSGGCFDRFDPVDGPDAVAAAIGDIHRWHRRRWECSVAGLVEAVIDLRLLELTALARPRPREAMRRLAWLCDQAREVDAEGGALRDLVARLQAMDVEGTAVSAPVPDADDDAVRIMTVHAAKGLEFPVVVMSGLGRQVPSLPVSVLVDRLSGEVEVRVPVRNVPKQRHIETPAFATLHESERRIATAERIRLGYVSATRARDHLIVPCHRAQEGRPTDATEWATTMADLETDGLVHRIAAGPVAEAAMRPVVASLDGVPDAELAAHREDEERWLRRRHVLAAAPVAEASATGVAEAARPDSIGRRRALAIGRAVHRVMEAIDFSDERALATLALQMAASEGVGHCARRVEILSAALWRSEPVRRAAERPHWRELPVSGVVDGVALQGVVDLLVEEPDGSLTVVDYKSERREAAAHHLDEYRRQLDLYAQLVERSAGRRVGRCHLVFAASGQVVEHRGRVAP